MQLGPRNGRQALVDLAYLDGFHAVVADHTCDGGGQMQRNVKVVQAVLHIAAQPLAYGMSSYTPSTEIPSSVQRRAMISPMSPEPKITARAGLRF